MIWRGPDLADAGHRLEQVEDPHLADDLVGLALLEDVGERAAGVLEPVLDLGSLPAGGGGLLEGCGRCSGVSGGRATVFGLLAAFGSVPRPRRSQRLVMSPPNLAIWRRAPQRGGQPGRASVGPGRPRRTGRTWPVWAGPGVSRAATRATRAVCATSGSGPVPREHLAARRGQDLATARRRRSPQGLDRRRPARRSPERARGSRPPEVEPEVVRPPCRPSRRRRARRCRAHRARAPALSRRGAAPRPTPRRLAVPQRACWTRARPPGWRSGPSTKTPRPVCGGEVERRAQRLEAEVGAHRDARRRARRRPGRGRPRRRPPSSSRCRRAWRRGSTSVPASRSPASARSRTATPREPNTSKKADCGLTTATCPANASTQVSVNRSSPSTSSARPHASTSARCGSMPAHSGPCVARSTGRKPRRRTVEWWARRLGHGRSLPWATPTASVNRSNPLSSQQLAQLARTRTGARRVVEDRRADLDGARAGRDELEGVAAGAHSPDADDRHRREPSLEHRRRGPARWRAPRPGGSPGRTGRR